TRFPPISEENEAESPYAVVLAPTRELAQRIMEETVKFAHYLGIKYLRNPVVMIIRTAGKATDLTQHLKEFEKMPWLQKLLDDLEDKTAIVFINTKKIADFVNKTLEKSGYRVTSLHGRDIDIPDVAHVMDYDMPRNIILIV
ncbi:DEAD-box ATP-dependent RNA helicase 21, partial [Tanacetum coccineum]